MYKELVFLSILLAPMTIFAEDTSGVDSQMDAPALQVQRTVDAVIGRWQGQMTARIPGMEAEVLRGAAGIIGRLQPVLYVENDRVEKSRELISLVLELGYTPYWHLARLYSPENFFGNAEDVFPDVASANMLCAPDWLNVTGLDDMRVTGPDQTWQDLV